MEVLRDAQRETGAPSAEVQNEPNLLGGTRADHFCERRQLYLEERNRDRGRPMKDGLPRSGTDNAQQIALCIEALHQSHGPLSTRRPHALQNGLDASAVLVP